jgi:4'-phosphopantetheinyl transferase
MRRAGSPVFNSYNSDVDSFTAAPALCSDVIHIVSCRLDAIPADAARLLNDTERERAERFVFEPHRRRYVSAHAHLRQVLGRCTGVPPASLRFASAPNGKPHLVEEDEPTRVRFNLSHSGERALIAVTLDREVGVDVEAERSFDDLMEVARRFFSTGEVAALAALAPAARPAAFFRCWTRKEAFVKAVGDGLRYPIAHVDVPLDAGATCVVTSASPRRSTWRIVDVPMDAPYVAALAAEEDDWRIQVWDGSDPSAPA